MPSGTPPNTHLTLTPEQIAYCQANGGKTKVIREALNEHMAGRGVIDNTPGDMDAAASIYALRFADIIALKTKYLASQGKKKELHYRAWLALRAEVARVLPPGKTAGGRAR